MDRVFLDANVLFSAAYIENSGLARLWRLKNVTLLSSAYAVEEARRNLDTMERRKRLESLLAGITINKGSFLEVDTPAGVKLPDNDAPILQAAAGMKATHLLTGDKKAFGRYYGKKINGVAIMRPADFLAGR